MELKKQQSNSDKQYKDALVRLIKSRTWHWFITIPIGACDGDDVVVRRLRRIEAILCGKYLLNRYHKLPDHLRYSMIVAFEGEVEKGTRHAHILAYIPTSMKRDLSHNYMIGMFPGQFRYLWATIERDDSIRSDTMNSTTIFDLRSEPHFDRANSARSIYTIKDVRLADVSWSNFQFVTPPKWKRFTNETLNVMKHNDKQVRRRLHADQLLRPLT